MKVRAVLIAAFVSFCAASVFAGEKSNLGFYAGIGSGYVIYGDGSVRDRNTDMNADSFSRFIFSGEVGIDIKLADQVSFTAGAETLSDLFWYGNQHCNYFDYALLSGLKVYPGLGGLVFSVNYVVGQRCDFVKLGDSDEAISTTKWGNGFQFEVDYDLSYGTGGWAPVFGGYWRYMPRGGSADNIISVFIRFELGS